MDGRGILSSKDKLIFGYVEQGAWADRSPMIVVDMKNFSFIVCII